MDLQQILSTRKIKFDRCVFEPSVLGYIMPEHLLAIDDVKEDFMDILKWAIEFKRMWKTGDEIAINFHPLADLTVGSIYLSLIHI